MRHKDPYQIIHSIWQTEKSMMLQSLHSKETGSVSLRRCKSPKYVFHVDAKANKQEIAAAVEYIYADSHIKVVAVNTINTADKPRRVRGREGVRRGIKKAIVTLAVGDVLPEKV